MANPTHTNIENIDNIRDNVVKRTRLHHYLEQVYSDLVVIKWKISDQAGVRAVDLVVDEKARQKLGKRYTKIENLAAQLPNISGAMKLFFEEPECLEGYFEYDKGNMADGLKYVETPTRARWFVAEAVDPEVIINEYLTKVENVLLEFFEITDSFEVANLTKTLAKLMHGLRRLLSVFGIKIDETQSEKAVSLHGKIAETLEGEKKLRGEMWAEFFHRDAVPQNISARDEAFPPGFVDCIK